MPTQLMQLLASSGAQRADVSDEEYVHSALKEFRRNSHTRSEFRQRATLEPERAFTAGEVRALSRVGLQRSERLRGDAERARREALAVFFTAFHTALSTAEAAALLGVNASRVRQRVKERTLLALNDASELRFPSIQFFKGKELPGLRSVLPALPEQVKAIEALSWLATPTAELADDGAEPRSPRDYLLATGETAPVIELARALKRGETA